MNLKEVQTTNEWLTDGTETVNPVKLERYNRLSELDWKATEGKLSGPERIERDQIGRMVPPNVRGF